MSESLQQALHEIEQLQELRDDLEAAMREIVNEAKSGRTDCLAEIQRIAERAIERAGNV